MKRRNFLAAVPAALLARPKSARAPSFVEARPVWLAGLSRERNIFAGFRLSFEAQPPDRVVLRLTASSVYRFWVDGQFGGYGPARGPHGWFRVDEWDVSSLVRDERNCIAIEVAGYNVNSYYLPDQPAFLLAELTVNGRVAASTGGQPRAFEAFLIRERVRKVQRYSFQRPFSEIYRIGAGSTDWRRRAPLAVAEHDIEEPPAVRLLPRGVPLPECGVHRPAAVVSEGTWQSGVVPPRYWRDRSLTAIGPRLGGFPEAELTEIPSLRLQEIRYETRPQPADSDSDPARFVLNDHSWRILDFGVNRSGFIGLRVSVNTETTLYALFDEILTSNDVDFRRLDCVNAVVWHLAPGVHTLETFEPYTLRYLKLMAARGGAGISGVMLREYCAGGAAKAEFASSDPALNRIFAAARETYRQNATDVFMDCPSRERAGWLCDSFFTARVAPLLSGHTQVERTFLENYLLPDKFAHLPAGMLPMCYPADHNDGVFIPNWPLWLVLQLEEYLARSHDRAMIDAFRPKVEALFGYFKQFLNRNGLLEKLQNWVFVEWSDANRFTQDVNYPSNMLYAAALDAAARLYKSAAWREQAAAVRAEVRRQSFDGEWFVDNAELHAGRPERTTNRSEVCQYFAFTFGVADFEKDAELWQRLVHRELGPLRPANAFVGHYLRLDLLARAGLAKQALDEARGFFLKMAEHTGTLWENDTPTASCNHGFASHVASLFYREALGLERFDPVKKQLWLRPRDNGLDSCRGVLPIPDGRVVIEWKRQKGKVRWKIEAPESWRVRKLRS